MAEKTAWEHVLDEPVVLAPGERPMKVQMDARFDGSFEQFVAWMQETFKNPSDMRCRVVVGNFALINEIVKEEKPEPKYSPEAHKLQNIATGSKLTLREAEDVVKKTYQAMKSTGRLQAIKALREATSLGLKEAKDFVESLPARKPEDEEIPF